MKNQNEKKEEIMKIFIIHINNLHHLPLDEGFTFDLAELFEIPCNLNPDH